MIMFKSGKHQSWVNEALTITLFQGGRGISPADLPVTRRNETECGLLVVYVLVSSQVASFFWDVVSPPPTELNSPNCRNVRNGQLSMDHLCPSPRQAIAAIAAWAGRWSQSAWEGNGHERDHLCTAAFFLCGPCPCWISGNSASSHEKYNQHRAIIWGSLDAIGFAWFCIENPLMCRDCAAKIWR